jgi:hypothetical protein
VSHVSLVGTISLGLKSLLPLLLTTSEVTFKSRELIRLHDGLSAFRTAKGYITIGVMNFCVNFLLGPYVKSVHSQFSDQSLNVYLVAENLDMHSHPNILTMLQRTGVVPIWLPPHSSHFLPPLDLTGFGSFKRHYGDLRRPRLKPQLEGKILHGLHAWDSEK